MTLDQKTQQSTTPLAYENSMEHLTDELRWLDMVIRLRVSELRQYNAGSRGVHADSQVAISHNEVDALLAASPVLEPDGIHRSSEYRKIEAAQAKIDARVRAGIQRGTFMALPQLAHLFALSHVEVQTVLVCLAPELDRKYDRLYAYLQDDITRKKPSVDLVLNLIFGSRPERWSARPVLSDGGALIRAGILNVCEDLQSPSGSSGLSQLLKLDQRILRYLLGDNGIDGRVRDLLRLENQCPPMDDVLVDRSIKRSLTNLVESRLTEQDMVRKKIVLHFHGPAGVGKQELALGLCHRLGRPLLRLDAESLVARAADAESDLRLIFRLIFRESLLLQAPLYIENADAMFAGDDRPHPIFKAISGMTREYGWLVMLGGEKPRPLHEMFQDTVFQSFEISRPGVPLREQAWQRSLGDLIAGSGKEWDRQLAGRFQLTPGQIRVASESARNNLAMNGGGEITLDDLYQACRNQSNAKLGELAAKTRPHYSWEDIVLPEGKVAQLREICAQVRHSYKVFGEWGFETKLPHGKGISVLFSGPPGTGKTMGAEVIANDLDVDLYRVDLSGVVSKYIGETEKNLARIFNESEASNAILFFDEADALFGKRTEVSDAHDRYANIETSYLLQKMEEYEGIVILATNLRENMDEAFTRRIRFIVEFPFPDTSSRLNIWKKHFPDAAPVAANLDYEFLAKEFAVAGGSIKNIVLNSAFFAAEDGEAISMNHIVHGARREFEKIGKSWNEPRPG